jgi:hypothetical protein
MPKQLFKPGQSGNPQGRRPGSKNKKSYLSEVVEICEVNGVNPFEILAQIAAGTLEKPDGNRETINACLRKEAAAELCQYLAPKLKAVEISNDPQNPIQVYMNFGNGTQIQRN